LNILITGATGFIGEYLTQSLTQKGHKVIISTRSAEKAKKIFGQKVEIFDWDYKDVKKITALINQVDIIINLAGENIAGGLWTKSQKKKILESRIKTGKIISQAIKQAQNKPKQLIQASAIGYYGFNPGNKCDENSEQGEGFLAHVCKQWEESASEVSNQHVKRAIIRTGVVLGNTGGMLPKLVQPIKFFLGADLGKGDNYISWIHIEDEIRAIEFIIENSLEGIFNLTAPEPVSSKELNKQIGAVLKKPVWLKVPAFLLNMLLGDLSKEVLLANQEVFPSNLTNAGFNFKYSNISEAIKSLVKKSR